MWKLKTFCKKSWLFVKTQDFFKKSRLFQKVFTFYKKSWVFSKWLKYGPMNNLVTYTSFYKAHFLISLKVRDWLTDSMTLPDLERLPPLIIGDHSQGSHGIIISNKWHNHGELCQNITWWQENGAQKRIMSLPPCPCCALVFIICTYVF